MYHLLARLRVLHEALTPEVDRFLPPDLSPNYTPCVSSQHVFCGPEGRLISIGMVRSDDTGTIGLRLVRERTDGGLDGLSLVAPQAMGASFQQDGQLPARMSTNRLLLSRGEHAIAGMYQSEDQTKPIHSVRFSLTLKPLERGVGIGQLGLRLGHLIATDFLRVLYRGELFLNGEKLQIDSVGSLSLHAGDRLPQYGYLVTSPHAANGLLPALLLLAVHDDSLRVLGESVGGQSVIYGLGRNGLPKVALHLGSLGPVLPLGDDGKLLFHDLRPFGYDFLGQPTVTALGDARFVSQQGTVRDLGRVFVDCRGAHFVTLLHS
jgi:hypothetical protein